MNKNINSDSLSNHMTNNSDELTGEQRISQAVNFLAVIISALPYARRSSIISAALAKARGKETVLPSNMWGWLPVEAPWTVLESAVKGMMWMLYVLQSPDYGDQQINQVAELAKTLASRSLTSDANLSDSPTAAGAMLSAMAGDPQLEKQVGPDAANLIRDVVAFYDCADPQFVLGGDPHELLQVMRTRTGQDIAADDSPRYRSQLSREQKTLSRIQGMRKFKGSLKGDPETIEVAAPSVNLNNEPPAAAGVSAEAAVQQLKELTAEWRTQQSAREDKTRELAKAAWAVQALEASNQVASLLADVAPDFSTTQGALNGAFDIIAAARQSGDISLLRALAQSVKRAFGSGVVSPSLVEKIMAGAPVSEDLFETVGPDDMKVQALLKSMNHPDSSGRWGTDRDDSQAGVADIKPVEDAEVQVSGGDL